MHQVAHRTLNQFMKLSGTIDLSLHSYLISFVFHLQTLGGLQASELLAFPSHSFSRSLLEVYNAPCIPRRYVVGRPPEGDHMRSTHLFSRLVMSAHHPEPDWFAGRLCLMQVRPLCCCKTRCRTWFSLRVHLRHGGLLDSSNWLPGADWQSW